ncbi:hypothetical protein M5K25_017676 [Dendrobium thyrsiflorum]|uniref:Uncharacterized protein n=1 Tax=Dendrobium thyrsiflorum TaxID=117978 RepID=A0ABD0UUR0_DENTH
MVLQQTFAAAIAEACAASAASRAEASSDNLNFDCSDAAVCLRSFNLPFAAFSLRKTSIHILTSWLAMARISRLSHDERKPTEPEAETMKPRGRRRSVTANRALRTELCRRSLPEQASCVQDEAEATERSPKDEALPTKPYQKSRSSWETKTKPTELMVEEASADRTLLADGRLSRRWRSCGRKPRRTKQATELAGDEDLVHQSVVPYLLPDPTLTDAVIFSEPSTSPTRQAASSSEPAFLKSQVLFDFDSFGDPEIKGRTDILNSPFFNVFFGSDETADDYLDRILYQLSLSLEEHIRPGRWILTGQPPPPPLPTTSPAARIFGITVKKATDLHSIYSWIPPLRLITSLNLIFSIGLRALAFRPAATAAAPPSLASHTTLEALGATTHFKGDEIVICSAICEVSSDSSISFSEKAVSLAVTSTNGRLMDSVDNESSKLESEEPSEIPRSSKSPTSPSPLDKGRLDLPVWGFTESTNLEDEALQPIRSGEEPFSASPQDSAPETSLTFFGPFKFFLKQANVVSNPPKSSILTLGFSTVDCGSRGLPFFTPRGFFKLNRDPIGRSSSSSGSARLPADDNNFLLLSLSTSSPIFEYLALGLCVLQEG